MLSLTRVVRIRSWSVVGLLCLACLSSPSQAADPVHQWSRRFGSANDDQGRAVALDGLGNVFITGWFSGPTDFGGGPLTPGSADVFVAKYDANGAHLWSRKLGSAVDDNGLAIAADGLGNVIVAGNFQNTVDFGGGGLTSAGAADLFVAKYDANGAHLWSRRFGGTGSDQIIEVAVDGSNNVFVAGAYQGTTDFGGGGLVSAGGYDMFLAKYSPTGAHEWSKRFGSTQDDEGRALATDGSGNVFLAGNFKGTVDFGGGGLLSTGGLDINLVKFDTNGAHQWSKRFGGVFDDRVFGVAVDGSDHPIITGAYAGTINFGGGGLTWLGGAGDVYLARFDANGTHQWSRSFGSPNNEQSLAVAANSVGSVFLTGFFVDPVNFGGGNLIGAGSNDIFCAKYSASGVHQWSKRLGSTGADVGLGVAVSGLSEVYFAGAFAGTVDFGGGGLLSAGAADIFVAKYSSGDVLDVPTESVRVAALGQNYPNPFHRTTSFGVSLLERSPLVVGVFDVAGSLVVRLDHGVKQAGRYSIEWNGRDAMGHPAREGLYFYRVEGMRNAPSKRMILLN